MSEILAAGAYFGMNGTGDWSDPELRPLNYRETHFKLFQDSPTPFTKFLSKMPSSAVDDPQFRIFEWRLPTMAWVTDGVIAVGTTTIDLDTTNGPSGVTIKEGDLLINENSGEIVRVTTGGTAASFVCVRGWGGTSAVETEDQDVWRWAGDAYEEGSGAPTAVSRRASVIENYCQIFKDTADVTGTAEATRTRPMKPWPQLKAEALERLMMKIESSFLWGTQGSATVNGQTLRTTSGFTEMVGTANTTNMSGMSIDELENAMMAAFMYGSKTKMGLCGYKALNLINQLVRSNTQFQFSDPISKKQTYGLNVRELMSPFGTLGLIPHPLMAESARYTEELYIIDPKYVEYVYLRGRDVDFKDKSQDNDEDARRGHWLAECGLRLALPETHAVWTNIDSIS
jgi:hypothetical protein